MELLKPHLKVSWDLQSKPQIICSYQQDFIAYGLLTLQTLNKVKKLQDKEQTPMELIHTILLRQQIKNHGLVYLLILLLLKTGGLQMTKQLEMLQLKLWQLEVLLTCTSLMVQIQIQLLKHITELLVLQ